MPPSAEHSAWLLLFENRPQLALELLHWLGHGTEAAEPASLQNVDLTTAITAEYRAALTPAQRDKVLDCTNLRTLDRWVRRAATATEAAELFAPG